MTDGSPRDPYAPPRALPEPSEPSELALWLLPREPRRLAWMFLLVLGLCFAGGGALALIMRLELLGPARDLISADTYNLAFTMHGVLLAVLFMLPAIPTTLGQFGVPRLLGVSRLALPRVGVVNFYVFVISVVLVVGTLAGTSMWSSELPPALELGLVGLVVSAGLTALGLVLTVRRRPRAGGRLPLFCWSIVLGAASTLVTLLIVVLMVVAVWGSRGGVFGQMFGFVTSAAPGLVLIPALGMVCEILEVHARGVSARRLAIAALVTLAVVAVPVWDGFDMGLSRQLGWIAVVLLLCAWTVPLAGHWRRGVTPLLYALAVVVMLVLAGLAGAALAALSDVYLGDTYFVVGYLHLRAYVVVLALLGGLHHWWWDLTGRRYHETAGRVGAALVAGGMAVHAIAMLVLGHQGMPRRYYSYLAEYTDLHRIATIGAGIIAVGLVWAVGTLLWSRKDP